MVALRIPKNRSEIRRHTGLAPLRANATQWGSTFTMLERYVRIRDEIKRVDAVYDLVLKPAAHRRIVALTETLKTFNSIAEKRKAELTPEDQDAVAPFKLISEANVPAATTQQRARTRTQAHSGAEDFATALLRSDDAPS
ncbi:hypothetical protein PF004_g4894 [Phytophthora fragariae]|uniref:Uncharacterized protein n=1 Tax=Phytophthora fragariae TaxID=53985 RepID=A0A6G0PHF2_9STRA|nr:hypothetical protein PF004_g4894 [Phytophthora fragariae]